MKSQITLLVLFAIWLTSCICTREKWSFNPANVSASQGHLIIKTDQRVYQWNPNEDRKQVIIQGTLRNNSAEIFYSRLGDYYESSSAQGKLFIADNSAGYIEKYDPANGSWKRVQILLLMIEGPRMTALSNGMSYAIYAHLSIENNRTEKGLYRIRIDYYREETPTESSLLYHDYSNVFELRIMQ
jgi:hypothetical protein